MIWWDDILIEENSTRHFIGTGPRQDALLAVADFNCPGEGTMKLDGKSSRKDDESKERKELHLVKGSTAPIFLDEWDFLIDNYVYGVNHPVVDSIEQPAFNVKFRREINIPGSAATGSIVGKASSENSSLAKFSWRNGIVPRKLCSVEKPVIKRRISARIPPSSRQ